MAKEESEHRGPSRAAGWLLGFIIMLGCAISAFVAFGGIPTPKGLSSIAALGASSLAIFGGTICVWQFAVLWHELGHYFAGRVVGLRLVSLRFAVFEIFRSGGSLRLRFVGSNGFLSGHCSMVRTDGLYTIRGLMIHVLGGPVATLILFFVFVWIATAISWNNAGGFQLFFWVWTLGLGAFALAGFVPNTWNRDMAHLRHFLQPDVKAACALTYAYNLDVRSGKRPREWNLEAVEYVASNSTDRERKLYDNLMAYYAYWDRGEADMAMLKIRAVAAECGEATSIEVTRKAALLESAFALARIEKDPESAAGALETAEALEAECTDHLALRVNAAISLAKRDWNAAVLHAHLAIAAVQKDAEKLTGWPEAEFEWIGAIVEEATAGSGPQEPVE